MAVAGLSFACLESPSPSQNVESFAIGSRYYSRNRPIGKWYQFTRSNSSMVKTSCAWQASVACIALNLALVTRDTRSRPSHHTRINSPGGSHVEQDGSHGCVQSSQWLPKYLRLRSKLGCLERPWLIFGNLSSLSPRRFLGFNKFPVEYFHQGSRDLCGTL